MPVLGQLFGYTPDFMNRAVQRTLQIAQADMQRPLTQEEAAAVAEHQYRALATVSYGQPLAVMAGVYRAYQTHGSYRFPFYKPDKKTFDPNKLAFLQGRPAQLTRHALRYGTYALLSNSVGKVLVLSYAVSVQAARTFRDPRLQEMNKERIAAAAARARLLRERRGEVVGQPGAAAPRKVADGAAGPPAPVDEASPSSGPVMEVMDSGSGMLSDSEMRAQEVRQRVSAERRPTSNRAASFEVDKVAPPPVNLGDDIDDVSPTGGSGAANNSSESSAWERIRRGASASQAPQSQSGGQKQGSSSRAWSQARADGMNQEEQREGSSSPSDSFSYASSAEERQRTRAEAQKAFDEEVERERRGGDFSSGGRTSGYGRRD
ncbi:MAG: hypothetical protein M1832_003639 [Thelocarpon impressellum]|nr:MAG: hypothetical protein M1832_003639 [Thelocarpon impressellum]